MSDSRATRPIGWGILAPGRIAAKLARDLALVPDARLVAVGSRDLGRAQAFVAEHGPAARAYADYAALVADPAVDVVYVASPHSLHDAQARLALAAGKHVLCEKPLTLDRASAAELIAAAGDRFLMEAMWSACHPVWRDLAARLRAGDFGTPHHLTADLSFAAGVTADHRLLNPDLGGGALLDIGIYPLTFAHVMLGEALELRAIGVLDAAGHGGLGAEPPAGAHGGGAPVPVEVDVAIAGRYPGDVLAELKTSLTSYSPNTALIGTDQGWIEVPGDFHSPPWFTFHRLRRRHEPPEVTRFDPPEPVIGLGYGNEIAHVGDCLRQGLTESPWVPHAQTLTVLGQIDELRRQVGAGHPARVGLG